MKTGLLQESLPVCLTFAWNRRGEGHGRNCICGSPLK